MERKTDMRRTEKYIERGQRQTDMRGEGQRGGERTKRNTDMRE